MSNIRRLAAAQAHVRNRRQQRALLEQEREFNRMRAEQAQQVRKDRNMNRIVGGIQTLAGIGAGIAGGMTGNPMLLAGGLGMTGAGLGTATGSSAVQSMAPVLAQMGGMAAAGYMHNQNMGAGVPAGGNWDPAAMNAQYHGTGVMPPSSYQPFIPPSQANLFPEVDYGFDFGSY